MKGVIKMKLYHGTRLDVKELILENGIAPNTTEASSGLDDSERCLDNGIFGFDNLDDAISFANDLCDKSGIAVFGFEVDNAIIDKEYDGNAYFYATDENVAANLEFEY